MRVSLVPAANEENASAELREAIRKRWAKIVGPCILFLLVTGLYNAVMKIMDLELTSVYHTLVLVKLGIGLVIFFLVSLLNGRSEKAQKFRQNETRYLNIICALMLVLVLAAGYMKSLAAVAPKKDRTKEVEPQVSQLVSPNSLFDSPADANSVRTWIILGSELSFPNKAT